MDQRDSGTEEEGAIVLLAKLKNDPQPIGWVFTEQADVSIGDKGIVVITDPDNEGTGRRPYTLVLLPSTYEYVTTIDRPAEGQEEAHEEAR